MLVEQFLERSALSSPDKVALVCDDRRLTYADLEGMSNAVALGLARLGVHPGDRVVIHLDNSVEAVVSIFAALKANAVFVPVNSTTKADKLAFLLNDCRAVALLSDARRLTVAEQAARSTSWLKALVLADSQASASRLDDRLEVRSFHELESTGGSARPERRRVSADLAALVYTSGSTGQPKGVMLSHFNMTTAATSITTYLENTADDVILNVLPLSFDYGLYQVLMGFKVGARVVLERSFAYPHETLETLVRERVTGFPIVPTISAILLRFDLSEYDLSSLRYLTNTGAALPTTHITLLRAALPHVRLYSMYGLTECKRVAYLPPDLIDSHPTSVGRAMPNVDVFVADDDGRRLGEGTGELVVRGSNVMVGYWERQEETARVLRAGPQVGQRVLLTGDVFRVDSDGLLYFVGRKGDIIKSRGEKVSPREVEDVIYDLAGVAEVAVVGVPDPVLGEAVKAYVTVRDGTALSEPDVLHHCAQRLEDFMVPRAVEFVPRLPKTGSGKIARRGLDARAEN